MPADQTDPEKKNRPEAAVSVHVYQPSIPFPKRLAKYQRDKQFGKFMEVLKQLTISIPFVDALAQMPSYAKFLKDIVQQAKPQRM